MGTYTREYTSINGRKILLAISEKSSDCVVIKVQNLCYSDECNSKIKSIALLLLCWVLYGIFLAHSFSVDAFFLIYLSFMVSQTLNLVKNEAITLLSEFALQTSTEYFLGLKSRLFLPINKVYDVAINEVICDLSVKYILIIRTKGILYKRKAVIPLITKLEPGIECLEIIYKSLRKRL